MQLPDGCGERRAVKVGADCPQSAANVATRHPRSRRGKETAPHPATGRQPSLVLVGRAPHRSVQLLVVKYQQLLIGVFLHLRLLFLWFGRKQLFQRCLIENVHADDL